METFDCSNEDGFSFDETFPQESSSTEVDANLLSKINAKNQKQMENDIVKSVTQEIKDPAEIKKHQELLLHLVRYGSSKRFSEYLKTLGFS